MKKIFSILLHLLLCRGQSASLFKEKQKQKQVFFPIPFGLIVFSKVLMKPGPEFKLLILKLYLFNMHRLYICLIHEY